MYTELMKKSFVVHIRSNMWGQNICFVCTNYIDLTI